MSSPLRILLVDDHEVVREGMAAMLATEAGLELCGSVGSLAQAREWLRRASPDLLLLDLRLGDEDGLALLQELQADNRAGNDRAGKDGAGKDGAGSDRAGKDRPCRVLVLTSSVDECSARQALELGAVGYLTKDMAAEDLLRAIKAAARDEIQLTPKLDQRRVRGSPASPPQLSLREQDVLQLLAEGLPNAEIGQRLGIAEATVKSHVGSLLAKLGVADRTQAAIWAWRRGVVRS